MSEDDTDDQNAEKITHQSGNFEQIFFLSLLKIGLLCLYQNTDLIISYEA